MVASAAKQHELQLASLDRRAAGTSGIVGADARFLSCEPLGILAPGRGSGNDEVESRVD